MSFSKDVVKSIKEEAARTGTSGSATFSLTFSLTFSNFLDVSPTLSNFLEPSENRPWEARGPQGPGEPRETVRNGMSS